MPFDATPIIPVAITDEDEVVMLLRRARERIDKNGFCKNFTSYEGRFCAVGGLLSDSEKREIDTATSLLYKALPWRYRWIMPVAEWEIDDRNATSAEKRIAAYNDAPNRTKAHVLALYDRAITLAKE